MTATVTFMLAENGWVANNSRLPVLVYCAVATGDCEAVARGF